jgi:N-acetylmuramoyl-L-alanine amidase
MAKRDWVRRAWKSPQGTLRGADGPSRGKTSVDLSQVLQERTGHAIEWIPSPHFTERKGMIEAVVLHYSATGSLEETIDLFLRKGPRVSIHYVIDRDGLIIQMVDLDKKALHAGESEFLGRTGVNDFSIGIELVNWGLLREREGVFFAWPDEYGTAYTGQSPVHVGGQWWEPFTGMQYRVLAELIRQIRVHYPAITSDRVVGHDRIAIPKGRKMDPGPAFSWGRVKKA